MYVMFLFFNYFINIYVAHESQKSKVCLPFSLIKCQTRCRSNCFAFFRLVSVQSMSNESGLYHIVNLYHLVAMNLTANVSCCIGHVVC